MCIKCSSVADSVKRNDVDCESILWEEYNGECFRTGNSEDWVPDSFERKRCPKCGGTVFEVLGTGEYETTAKCVKCRIYYVVHDG